MITSLYGAVLALLFVGLSIRTIGLRRRHRVAVGDAGNEELLRAMRVHSNFAEYVPLTLLLIYMLEAPGTQPALIHALCLSLLIGRVAHAYGVSRVGEDYRFRVFGMAATFTALVGAAIFLLWRFVVRVVI